MACAMKGAQHCYRRPHPRTASWTYLPRPAPCLATRVTLAILRRTRRQSHGSCLREPAANCTSLPSGLSTGNSRRPAAAMRLSHGVTKTESEWPQLQPLAESGRLGAGGSLFAQACWRTTDLRLIPCISFVALCLLRGRTAEGTKDIRCVTRPSLFHLSQQTACRR